MVFDGRSKRAIYPESLIGDGPVHLVKADSWGSMQCGTGWKLVMLRDVLRATQTWVFSTYATRASSQADTASVER